MVVKLLLGLLLRGMRDRLALGMGFGGPLGLSFYFEYPWVAMRERLGWLIELTAGECAYDAVL